jgi:hypothetical protein
MGELDHTPEKQIAVLESRDLAERLQETKASAPKSAA